MMDDDDKWWRYGQTPPAPAETSQEKCERVLREARAMLEQIGRERAEQERQRRGSAPDAVWRTAKFTPARLAEMYAIMDRRAR